jgi:HEAT repeat protein
VRCGRAGDYWASLVEKTSGKTEKGTVMKRKMIGWLLAASLAGCASSSSHDAKILPPPPQTPPAPKYSPQALDPNLRVKAKAELVAESNAADPFLRCNAIEAMSEVDQPDDVPVVLRELKAKEPSVRFAAAVAAGQMKLVDAYEPLLAMVNDPDLRVQAGVRFALHRLGDTRLSHDLEKLAGNSDPHVRGTTAFVVGLLKDPSATQLLTTLLADKSPAVRIQAAEALWRLGNARGLEDLVAFSISGYPDDQIIALQAIAETGDQRVIQHVRGELQSDYTEVSLAAARGLGMLGSDEGWSVAVPAARSKDPRQRSLAALAMGAIGRSDLQPYLRDLLDDPAPTVRISAATAILQLKSVG